jgi:hypothetical protein
MIPSMSHRDSHAVPLTLMARTAHRALRAIDRQRIGVLPMGSPLGSAARRVASGKSFHQQESLP